MTIYIHNGPCRDQPWSCHDRDHIHTKNISYLFNYRYINKSANHWWSSGYPLIDWKCRHRQDNREKSCIYTRRFAIRIQTRCSQQHEQVLKQALLLSGATAAQAALHKRCLYPCPSDTRCSTKHYFLIHVSKRHNVLSQALLPKFLLQCLSDTRCYHKHYSIMLQSRLICPTKDINTYTKMVNSNINIWVGWFKV